MYFMAHFDQRGASIQDYDVALINHVYGPAASALPAPKAISTTIMKKSDKVVFLNHVTDAAGKSVAGSAAQSIP